jgi:hypothetical protein
LSCKIGFLNKIKKRKGISLNINKKQLEKKPHKKALIKKNKGQALLSLSNKASPPTLFFQYLCDFFLVAIGANDMI